MEASEKSSFNNGIHKSDYLPLIHEQTSFNTHGVLRLIVETLRVDSTREPKQLL